MINNKLFRKLAENFLKMKKIISTVILAAIVVGCNKTAGGGASSMDKLQNDDQKAAYAYGMNVGSQVKQYGEQLKGKEDSLNYKELERGLMDFMKIDSKNRTSYATGQNIGLSIQNFLKQNNLEGIVDEKIIVQGLMDKLYDKKTLFPEDSINGFMTKYLTAVQDKVKNKNLEEGTRYLEKLKTNKNIKTTESGLMYEVISEGTGQMPVDGSTVEVNYVGKTIDGKTFDESKKGEPVKFNLSGVIKGWQEGLKLMKAGSKYKFYIPSELAYGEFGSPDGSIKPNSTLIFDVELLSTQEPQKVDSSTLPQIPSPNKK